MKKHLDAIVVAGVVVAAFGILVSYSHSNRTEIGQVREGLGKEIQEVRDDVRTSTDRIIGVLHTIETNTAITRVEVEHNKDDIKKLDSDVDVIKSDIHDLGHRIDGQLVTREEESSKQ